MVIRLFLAGCLALTPAAIPAALAQIASVPAAPVAKPAVPPAAPAAPRLEPSALPSMPKPAPAPVVAIPKDSFGGEFNDDLVSVGGGGASAASAAPSPADAVSTPGAPSYSDICQASPKPPWCGDAAAPKVTGKPQ